MARLGMDVDVVERVGRQLQRQGDYLSTVVSQIDGLVSQSSALWHGTDGQGFADEWRNGHRHALLATSQAARELGSRAIANAAEQRRVSAATGGSLARGSALEGVRDATGHSPDVLGYAVDGLFELGEGMAAWGMRLNGYKLVPADISPWELAARWAKTDGWQALPDHDEAFRSFNVLHKGFENAGTLWTFATAALTQVRSDLDDASVPSTGSVVGDTALLVSRAAAVGGLAGIGGAGGAAAGALVGSMILPGPGTAIGAMVGGVAGGIVGSEAGVAVGHTAVSVTTAVGNAVGGELYDAGVAASSAVEHGSQAVHELLDGAGGAVESLVTPASWWRSQ